MQHRDILQPFIRQYKELMRKLRPHEELEMLSNHQRMLMNCKLRNGTSGGPVFTVSLNEQGFLNFPRVSLPHPNFLVGIYCRGFPKCGEHDRIYHITQACRIWHTFPRSLVYAACDMNDVCGARQHVPMGQALQNMARVPKPTSRQSNESGFAVTIADQRASYLVSTACVILSPI